MLVYVYLGYSHLSKDTIKNFTKAKWNNLAELRICNYCSKIDLCTLEEESVNVLKKC